MRSMSTSHPRGLTLAVLALLAFGALGADCQGFGPGFPPPIVDPPFGPVGVMSLAGPDLVVLEGSRIALAGRASRAFGGEPLLAWSQLAGPPVLLTNPSSALPAFVAPFAEIEGVGTTLVFELRADASGASAVDQVVVEVVSAEGADRGPAGFLEVPADTVAEPGSQHTFSVEVDGASSLPASITARLSCVDGGTVSIAASGDRRADVSLVLPQTLPCAVIIDGTDAAGRGLAPAARVFWPPGTPLPSPTALRITDDESGLPGSQLDPGSAATLSFGDDGVGRAWSVDGTDELQLNGNEGNAGNEGDDGTEIPVDAPRRKARLAIAGEVFLGAASGGVKVEFVEVGDGSANIAPNADGGPDRVVAPGAAFRLDTSGSFDLDGDPLVVTAEQVLGASALPDALVGGAFRAPDAPGVLLFHVVADDGTVFSDPDPVRVTVSTDSENLAPVLALPATRYAIPGETFAVDGSDAEDPDSGFIALVTIAQAEDDAVILLDTPVEASRVELQAGADGDEYHFLISAYDEEGLGVTVAQTVRVEDAGPYVDAARGDDATGNGTAAAPFATVGGALATAVLHELPELLLAAGTHAPLGGVVLPPRVSLRGGVVFDVDSDAYVDDALAVTLLPVNSTGLGVVDGRLTALTLDLASATASITLEGAGTLERVTVTVSAPDHAASLVVVRSLAAARISEAILVPLIGAGPTAPATAPTLVVEDGAVARLVGSVIAGADGPDAVGVSCGAATVSLENSDVTGAADAARGTGIRASAGCALDVTASRIVGGFANDALGIDATDTLLTTDVLSTLVGNSGAGDSGVAVRFAGRDRSALIESSLLAIDAAEGATIATAVGLLCDDAQVGLAGARVEARGTLAVALQPDRCVIGAVNTAFTADTAGVRGTAVDDVTLFGGTIDAGEVGVDLDGGATRALRGVLITAGAVGVRVAGDVDLDGVTIVVGGADEPVGVDAVALTARDSDITVDGDAARGVVVTDGSSLKRCIVRTGTSAAPAITSASALYIESSIVIVTGAPAVASVGELTLRHATLLADGAAGVRLTGATLDAANSYVAAVESDGEPWYQAIALAFATPGPFVLLPGGPLTTDAQVDDAGCNQCISVDPLLVFDPTGHLLPFGNALVDAGDDDVSTIDDVDNEPRPQGAGPDIGADERSDG